MFESPSVEINRAAKALSFEDICRTQQNFTRISFQLKEFCRLLPEGKRELVCGIVKEIELEKEFPDKLDKIDLAFTYVSSAVENVLQLDNIRKDVKREIHKSTQLILNGLDQNQNVLVQLVLEALQKRGDHDQQFKELLEKLEAVIFELAERHIKDPVMKDYIDEAHNYLKDPEMNMKDRIVVTIPLIPLFLTYQGVIELQSGLNLLGAWSKLTNSLRL
jgi:hypothetical protein